MSDVDTTTADEETEVKAEEAETKKSKKDPLPDGWVTPSGLVHVLKERHGIEVKPQQIYGYVYHGKDFPSKHHTDGRFIVPTDDAAEWVVNQRAKAAERKAKAAAKKAAEAEEAQKQEAQPEVVAAEPTSPDEYEEEVEVPEF